MHRRAGAGGQGRARPFKGRKGPKGLKGRKGRGGRGRGGTARGGRLRRKAAAPEDAAQNGGSERSTAILPACSRAWPPAAWRSQARSPGTETTAATTFKAARR